MLLIGTGRVARALVHRFQEVGYPITELWGRNLLAVRSICEGTFTRSPQDLNFVNPEPGTCLIAVSDGAIGEVAARLREHLHPDTLVAHTSGATPSTVLAPHFARYGTFYPLQSFTARRTPDWNQIPLLYAASDARGEAQLLEKAHRIAQRVERMDDVTRNRLHVAAVVVNNFTNHLYRLAENYCAQNDLDFTLLQPLMEETTGKLRQMTPAEAQTGPARRGDRATIERHLALLESDPALRALYAQFSDAIGRFHAGPAEEI